MAEHLPDLEQHSQLLHIYENQNASIHIIEFRQHEASILGYTGKDFLCISVSNVDEAVDKADSRAVRTCATHAGNLLRSGEEALQHVFEVRFKFSDTEGKTPSSYLSLA